MARQEHPREDLLRDAAAYVERIELLIPDQPDPIFAGFRSEGACSIYLGQDRVLQFNNDGHLRRVYWDGMMYKADRGHLVAISRNRDRPNLRIVSQPLDGDREERLLLMLAQELVRLQGQLTASRFHVRGEVRTTSESVLDRFLRWLVDLSGPLAVAQSTRLLR